MLQNDRKRLVSAALLCVFGLPAATRAQTNVPQPFPRPSPAQPSRPAPAPPVPPAQASAEPVAGEPAPSEAYLGVPVYPGAEFIASYDAGQGQRFYIFGSGTPFVDLVTYYRTVLNQRGNQVYDVPATHQFEVGRFRNETMAFPPGVTIKDFESEISQGYPNPKPGGQPERFRSIIQIVPVVPEG